MKIHFIKESIKNAKCENCGKPAEFVVLAGELTASGLAFSCFNCLDYFKKVPIRKW